MKTVNLEQAKLDTCIAEAQQERVVVLRDGKPVALIVGVEGMDEEQLRLGSSDKFWKLIAERRQQKILSRLQLEERLRNAGS
jgi:antitoxin (DNA-binding transcriptional repressor) of toxin-antitoxin stability system